MKNNDGDNMLQRAQASGFTHCTDLVMDLMIKQGLNPFDPKPKNQTK